MAAVISGRSTMDSQYETQSGGGDRLNRLYPAVNEDKTPLPRAWSQKEKYNYIGLSQNNLRVHYKGKIFHKIKISVAQCLLHSVFLQFD